MPDFTNIITVDLTEATGYNVEAHRAVHQWDSGVILQLTGATFPQGTTCQFDTKTTTFNQELTDGACEIPNALLGYDMIGDIKAHVKIDDDDYGIVVYDIHIPVIRRPKPDSYIYTDNSSSSNGWVKSTYGYRVNEDQTILGRTELSINNNQTILGTTSLSLNNQQTILDGTHLSLASGAFYADSTHLQLNNGRVTIGPTEILIDDRVYGTINRLDAKRFVQGYINADGTEGTDTAVAPSYIKSIDFISVTANTTYILSCNLAAYTLSVFEYDSNGSFLRFATVVQGATAAFAFTLGANTKYIRLQLSNYSGGSVQVTYPGDITWAQLEEGSIVTSPSKLYCLDLVDLTERRFVQDWESKNLADVGRIIGGSSINPLDKNRLFLPRTKIYPGRPYCLKYTIASDVTAGSFWIEDIILYDSAGTQVAVIHPTNGTAGNVVKFNAPINGEYIAIQWLYYHVEAMSSNITSIQLEAGTELTGHAIKHCLDASALTDRRFVQDFESRNLANINAIRQGGINGSSGVPVPGNTLAIYVDALIRVKPNNLYVLTWEGTALQPAIFYYGADRGFISYIQPISSNVYQVVVKIPNNINFVRLSWDKNGGGDVPTSAITALQFELKTTRSTNKSPYVPFAMSVEDLSNDLQGIFVDRAYKGINYDEFGFCTMTYYSPTLDSTTIDDLLTDLRSSRGAKQGSVGLSQAYGSEGSSPYIPGGWYHYEFIPHRTGGLTADNSQYCLLRLSNFFDGHQYELTFAASGTGVVLQTSRTIYSDIGGIRQFRLAASSSLYLNLKLGVQPPSYGSYRVMGYLANVGGIDVMININNYVLSAYNSFDSSAWGYSHYMSFSMSGDNLLISTAAGIEARIYVFGV